jgi:hypothetical protein
MVTLYADGKPINWADAERVVPECIARNQKVELRNDAGQQVGLITPTPAPNPNEPLTPWEASITQEEIERRMAGPFVTFEELKKRLGWE